VTYKLRASYDITPTDNVYVTTATGYLPGNVNIAQAANNTVVALGYGQERLTSYELGTKNRLFDNTLQVNGDVFYYNYAGYQQGVNLGSRFPGDPPNNVILTVPARMDGYELELLYLVTANDKLGFDIGHLDSAFVNKSAEFAEYLANKSIPGVAPTTLAASYTHTMSLADGSTLSFYDQFRYSTHSVAGMQQSQVDAGGGPYSISPDSLIDDVSGNWTSADSKYSVTLYVHNVGNQVLNTSGINQINNEGTATQQIYRGVNLTMPRTLGVVLHANF
jgi:iron complex outermembrane receptor protein